MATFTQEQYREILSRSERNKLRNAPTPEDSRLSEQAVDEEGKLHQEIMAYCDSQWPRWKYIHARMDKPSCIQKGANDITAFLPGGNVLCIECKKRGGKLDPDQLAWKLEMEMVGHKVHVVYCMDDFRNVLKEINL